MAEFDSENAREAYLRGRLEGLNELISVLKESLDSGDNNALSKSLAGHIASELGGLIDELRGNAPRVEIKKIEAKHEELRKAGEKSPEVSKETVKKAEDLMQSLMAIKK